MRKNEHLSQISVVLIGVGSSVWLIWQDFLYLIPVLGIVGSLLAYHYQEKKIQKGRAFERLNKGLGELLQPDEQMQMSINRAIKDGLDEIKIDDERN